MNNHLSTEDPEQRGFLTKMKGLFGMGEAEEEDYDDEYHPTEETRVRPVSSRFHPAKVSHVSIRLPVTFEDARLAADGLKEGRQQIVNLDKTPQEMSERIVDFLNGVTYALNGFVERVGDRVFLFAPSNVVIEVPEDMRRSSVSVFEAGSQ
ncbi:MAG: cell division protein SepF [Armatimonadetes bacterium]|nr:cell division protein SepF [Armatimonadota bacterium]